MPFHIIWYIQLQPNVGLFSSFRAICRDKTKQGVCPKVPRSNKYASCTQDCSSDSDCDGDEKCCFNGNSSRDFIIITKCEKNLYLFLIKIDHLSILHASQNIFLSQDVAALAWQL